MYCSFEHRTFEHNTRTPKCIVASIVFIRMLFVFYHFWLCAFFICIYIPCDKRYFISWLDVNNGSFLSQSSFLSCCFFCCHQMYHIFFPSSQSFHAYFVSLSTAFHCCNFSRMQLMLINGKCSFFKNLLFLQVPDTSPFLAACIIIIIIE